MIGKIVSSWKELRNIIFSVRKTKSSSGGNDLVTIEKKWVEHKSSGGSSRCIFVDAQYLHYAYQRRDDSMGRRKEQHILSNILSENLSTIRYVNHPNASGGMRTYLHRMRNTSIDVVSPGEHTSSWLIDKISQQGVGDLHFIGKISEFGINVVKSTFPDTSITVFVHKDDVQFPHETPLKRWGC